MNDRNLSELTALLKGKPSLSKAEINASITCLVNPRIEESHKIEFLEAMSQKGVTEEEFSNFVRDLRNRAIDPGLEEFADHAIDLCGTGGDKAGSFNVSTFVSFILASSGVPVIKHGNRSISSKCGSADLIEAVGIPLAPNAKVLKKGIEELNYAFLFAPQYHPAFKEIAPIRKSLAQRGVLTFFNVMGPMINPARPAYQLVGTYDSTYLSSMARALEDNGVKAGLIAHSRINRDGIGSVDELTACGENMVKGFGHVKTEGVENWPPSKWGEDSYPIGHLRGGDLRENLRIMKSILNGDSHPGLTATILINAATAFKICEKVKTLQEGMALAESIIKEGKLKDWLTRASSFSTTL